MGGNQTRDRIKLYGVHLSMAGNQTHTLYDHVFDSHPYKGVLHTTLYDHVFDSHP
jgi:hypothetical protein